MGMREFAYRHIYLWAYFYTFLYWKRKYDYSARKRLSSYIFSPFFAHFMPLICQNIKIRSKNGLSVILNMTRQGYISHKVIF